MCMCDPETAFETVGTGMDEDNRWLEANTDYTERIIVMLEYEKGRFPKSWKTEIDLCSTLGILPDSTHLAFYRIF